MQNPTLSGAQHGRVRPYREVPGGIALDTAQGLVIRPCALRLVKESLVYTFADYARQYLASRGDKSYLPQQLIVWTQFFMLHHALIEISQAPEAPHVPMFPLPPTLADASGKINPLVISTLPLHDAVEGQLGRLAREYEILKETETPVSIGHAKWEAIVNEGKLESLKTLRSRHGSSALIQVLHGMTGDYPE
jgi:hypothetical protein